MAAAERIERSEGVKLETAPGINAVGALVMVAAESLSSGCEF